MGFFDLFKKKKSVDTPVERVENLTPEEAAAAEVREQEEEKAVVEAERKVS